MADGFAGDPFHEGASQPMESLQGGMVGPYTQPPMDSVNSNDGRGGGTTEAPMTGTWSSTSLDSSGGDHKNPANGKTNY